MKNNSVALPQGYKIELKKFRFEKKRIIGFYEGDET
jgi:hypothetical protein